MYPLSLRIDLHEHVVRLNPYGIKKRLVAQNIRYMNRGQMPDRHDFGSLRVNAHWRNNAKLVDRGIQSL